MRTGGRALADGPMLTQTNRPVCVGAWGSGVLALLFLAVQKKG